MRGKLLQLFSWSDSLLRILPGAHMINLVVDTLGIEFLYTCSFRQLYNKLSKWLSFVEREGNGTGSPLQSIDWGRSCWEIGEQAKQSWHKYISAHTQRNVLEKVLQLIQANLSVQMFGRNYVYEICSISNQLAHYTETGAFYQRNDMGIVGSHWCLLFKFLNL